MPYGRGAVAGAGPPSHLPLMTVSAEAGSAELESHDHEEATPALAPTFYMAFQHQKTRRRRGSLRKAALLGRGVQRDWRDDPYSVFDTPPSDEPQPHISGNMKALLVEHDALGLQVSKPRQLVQEESLSKYAASPNTAPLLSNTCATGIGVERDRDGSKIYTSTTDEEDLLQMSSAFSPPRTLMSISSSSETYFAAAGAIDRPKSFQQPKSPLSYGGISTNTLPAPESDWDYSETEWWGWAVLTVTWLIFVIGMGSCLDIWSWAWDVGKTPYAPPELEDDPTLPIVGYYPALIIMTGVMAWVWVVVAWVGMKYFRHAKISGD